MYLHFMKLYCCIEINRRGAWEAGGLLPLGLTGFMTEWDSDINGVGGRQCDMAAFIALENENLDENTAE